MTIKKIQNENGPTLTCSTDSGLDILKVDGHFFKDNDRTGQLKPFEDWRLSPVKRAEDLSQRLSIKDIAGLMLFSAHLAIPSVGARGQLYDGKPFEKSGHKPSDLTDTQIDYVKHRGIRHTLLTQVSSPADAATWNNNIQELAEKGMWSIPVVNSTDPRHGYNSDTEFNEGSGGKISQWPEQTGIGATFDPAVAKKFGEVASTEDRALGISMYLGPQVDLATEPRWMRFNGTFGESAHLSSDLASALVEGLQDSNHTGKWGHNSVSAMSKHWPGGGAIEGGRDAHFEYGKYSVYPGNNQSYQLKTFESIIDSKKPSVQRTAGIMPYYSISYNFAKGHDNVGNAYDHYLITDLLRNHYGYDEVVSTDWCITENEPTNPLDILSGDQCWGVEDGYTVAERHARLIMAGIDQFGGNKDPKPILEAFDIISNLMGEPWAEARFRQSAKRILKNVFQLGLFEDAYTDPKKAEEIVGSPENVKIGLEAQAKSVIMLKNAGAVLPIQKDTKVYIPKRHYPQQVGWYLEKLSAHDDYSLNLAATKGHFKFVDDPDEADVALVRIKSPERAFVKYNGYDPELAKKPDDNGFLPISLQYKPYTAKMARKVSIAGDSRKGRTLNRSYQGKTTDTLNAKDLELVEDTRKEMGTKPVIVSIDTANPFVLAEIEPLADVIMLDFGVSHRLLYELMTGEREPSGLLPFQMPKDMDTVETQDEDTPFDMTPYTDSEGHTYDFGFGMNFEGQIHDWRTETYVKDTEFNQVPAKL